MKQPIANIVLKLDKIGATVALKHVTPAEAMLLCAMHSGNAGEMTIVKFELIDTKSNEMALKSLQDELSKQEALLEGLGYSIMPLIGIRNELLNKQLQIIPFKGFPILSTWYFIWLKEKKLSPVASAFLSHIRKEKQHIIRDRFDWFENYGY